MGPRGAAPPDSPTTPYETPIGAALLRAIESIAAGSTAADVLYSGGLDSSVVAQVARLKLDVQLVSVGLPESPDLTAAYTGGELLGLPLRREVVTPDDVRSSAERWLAHLEGVGQVDRAVLTATAVALESARRPLVLCGQGADELFLGYAHFRGLDPSQARSRQQQDWTRLQDLIWPRSQAIARALGRRLASPFLDPAFVEEVERVPVTQRLPDPEPKSLLRRVARELGVPPELTNRRKRAFQYGSRIGRFVPASVDSLETSANPQMPPDPDSVG